jgi:hypothetical protein
VSVFIANPIHVVGEFTPPRYPKRKGGDLKALAGCFPDMYGANDNHAGAALRPPA